MELLTILYALLAAVTGIGGGERVALADRAAMAASVEGGCAVAIGSQAAARVADRAARPDNGARILAMVRALAPTALTARTLLPFDVASFANRRE